MQLEGFSVRGIQSLAEIEQIPVGQPTILTGANDGGKTASISALGFLLGGPAPKPEAHTWAREGDDPPGGISDDRFAEACVIGRFSLEESEQLELSLPGELLIRRRASAEDGTSYEMQVEVPVDERLRALTSDLRLNDLKERAQSLGVDPVGSATAKASFLTPLQDLADTAPKTTDWVTAPRDLLDLLPRFLAFSSSREPDPEAEIGTILRDEYTRILEDPDLVGALTEIEEDVQSKIQREADDLRGHIRGRVPELIDIDIVPTVSFSGGFRGAALFTSTGAGESVPLVGVGSGRRRRMTLAIWEWASGILSREDPPRTTVIAYDEPA